MRKRRQTHVQSLMAQAFYVCLCIYIYRERVLQDKELKLKLRHMHHLKQELEAVQTIHNHFLTGRHI